MSTTSSTPNEYHGLGRAHGAALLVYLLWLNWEKAGRMEGMPWSDKAMAVLMELGFVLLLESLLVLAHPRGTTRRGRLLWKAAFLGSHVAVYGVTLLEHTFFLNTGTRLHFDLIGYGLGNLQMLSSVLSSGIDRRFLLHLLLATLCLLGAIALGRRLAALPRAPRRVALLAAAGALCVAVPMVGVSVRSIGSARPLATNAILDWSIAGLTRTSPKAIRLEDLVPPDEHYAPPTNLSKPLRRPNIVLLILESTRADMVAPLATREAGLTPRMEQIASQSLVVEDAYASVTHTSKALIGVLCGMYPRLVMEVHESQEGNQPLRCLPHILGDLGYRTAFMKSALGSFENFQGLISNLGYELGAFREQLERPPFQRTGYLGLDELAMLAPALAWAADSPKEPSEQPFFLTLLTVTPHHPYHVPGRAKPILHQDDAYENYKQALAYQDRFVGLLFDQLVTSGLIEDGLFIVLGDHGEAFGEHVVREHDAVAWQEGIRVPWLLYGPELLGAPRRISGVRSQLDLLPTILELMGVEAEGRAPGKSLFGPGHDRIWSSCWYTDYCIGLRESDRKVVYHFNRLPTELYQLSVDPGERNDLAPSMPSQEIHQIEREILAWKASVDLFYTTHPLAQEAKEPGRPGFTDRTVP